MVGSRGFASSAHDDHSDLSLSHPTGNATSGEIMTTNILAIAILADGSLSLASEWNRVLSEYITPVLTRLANELYNGYHVRLAIITYGTADTRPSPVLCTRFFVNPVAISKEMKETPFSLGVGVASQGERGMAALEGYAATIEVCGLQ